MVDRMNVVRLTDPRDVIKYWDVFRAGLAEIDKLTGESMSENDYCKMLINLVARGDDAWVGIVMQGGPMSYAVAIDSTPPLSNVRTFTCVSFYAMKDRPDATEFLQREFERWARTQGVKSYIVTTRRTTGGAFKCFWSRSNRYGFKRGFYAFEKAL